MSWLIVFLGFCFLIMIHEAGHFFAAKATGMRVERFFLFFGPTIWSFKRGETEYGIKSIPIGGYVKITGMNPEEDVPPEHAENPTVVPARSLVRPVSRPPTGRAVRCPVRRRHARRPPGAG